VIVIIFSDSST